MQEQRPPPLPPLTAEMALACYKCFKDEDVRLSRCSQCSMPPNRLLQSRMPNEFDDTIYKLDWKMHKPMCKALSEIEKNRDTFVSLPSKPTKRLDLSEQHNSGVYLQYGSIMHVQRELTLFERNLISSEPRCMICTRTDQLIRIEAAIKGTHTSSSPLIPCPQCGLNFCSSDNWDAARVLHHVPCDEARDGISQCEMNMQVREDIKFQNFWTGYADEKNISRNECTQHGCKRIKEHAVDTYHAYVQKKGSIFERPDLCIAMNSGASQVSRRTWPETFRTLVKRRIPTLFTSFNREEADAEAALLRAAGATLHAALGPGKNPLGSLQVTPSHHKVYGFSAASGWIAGGFR
ncbi:hypothetical protein C8J57DRAFT_1562811 [Mycena rebaudengoi]|nr:hypothetical protein C8J57DRAFT_1562811 [Mycena rebaudengoi]